MAKPYVKFWVYVLLMISEVFVVVVKFRVSPLTSLIPMPTFAPFASLICVKTITDMRRAIT